MMRVLRDLGLPVGTTREGTSLRVEIALHVDERYAAASEARHRAAAAASLRAVLDPGTVVVIGAGRSEHSIGRAVLRKLRSTGFPGELLVVNPHAGDIEGVPCRPSVSALPGPVDLAVLTVPAASVEATVEECGEHGVRALVVISSGLSAPRPSWRRR